MHNTRTTIYCLCEDFLKAIYQRGVQGQLSTARVMVAPLVAATFFAGNIDKTRMNKPCRHPSLAKC